MIIFILPSIDMFHKVLDKALNNTILKMAINNIGW